METFSVRNGFVLTALIVNDIPQQARTRLYNFFHDTVTYVSKEYDRYGRDISTDQKKRETLKNLWVNLFYWSVSDKPYDNHTTFRKVEEFFKTAAWHAIYSKLEDFLIFLQVNKRENIHLNNLVRILKEERLGYQVLETDNKFQFIPLSNTLELSEIESATQVKDNFLVAQEHIKKAISAFSQKPNPDYTNTIKESISAVESVCRDKTGKSALGDSLKALQNNGLINAQLADGIHKMYAYTNNPADGIRHSKLSEEAENSTANYDEAKFFIVFCSALVNYLTSKLNASN